MPFPVILFAVHTYYALLMKLLATEVIVAQGGLGDSFIGSLTGSNLASQLGELESGAILERYNIRNAIEQDFFGWYTAAWTAEAQAVLWRMCRTLSSYDVGTFELKPERARDLLKDLYHGLVAEAVRRALEIFAATGSRNTLLNWLDSTETPTRRSSTLLAAPGHSS